ncbi:MAG TPA: methylated-DNA--[protein]-cysteine S-methyltransferase [Thermoanaerobaculia bacterium]|nr:methylated-DNA--[protein]-cysteine S-methyltransferase [Thermoanaerobaculia bacterium]
MKTSSRRAPANAIDIVRELRAASSFRAPASLLPEVLRRVGLADLYWKLESPVGPVYVAASRAGISMVSRARSAEEFERRFESQRGRPISPATSRPPAAVRALMKNLKCRDREKLQFDLRGLSEFERAVLMKALEIPGGEIRPYSWIAREIGHPEAVRAVGTALGKNPVPLLIPCHRVVRADGTLGKYSMGGSRIKRALLEVEEVDPATIEKLASRGIRYLGNEERRYYCYPTCGGTRSLVLSNKIPFHNEKEALAAGYRPCKACRPAA